MLKRTEEKNAIDMGENENICKHSRDDKASPYVKGKLKSQKQQGFLTAECETINATSNVVD